MVLIRGISMKRVRAACWWGLFGDSVLKRSFWSTMAYIAYATGKKRELRLSGSFPPYGLYHLKKKLMRRDKY